MSFRRFDKHNIQGTLVIPVECVNSKTGKHNLTLITDVHGNTQVRTDCRIAVEVDAMMRLGGAVCSQYIESFKAGVRVNDAYDKKREAFLDAASHRYKPHEWMRRHAKSALAEAMKFEHAKVEARAGAKYFVPLQQHWTPYEKLLARLMGCSKRFLRKSERNGDITFGGNLDAVAKVNAETGLYEIAPNIPWGIDSIMERARNPKTPRHKWCPVCQADLEYPETHCSRSLHQRRVKSQFEQTIAHINRLRRQQRLNR